MDLRADPNTIMGGPALTLRGSYGAFVVDCDGVVVASAPTFDEASARYRELKAHRAFGAALLHHTLAQTAPERRP